MKKLIFVLSCLFLWSCSNDKPQNEDQAKECAQNFAEAFYNFNFNEARKYCSEESVPNLTFYVSNITRADIDSIRKVEEKPTVKVEKVVRYENDSIAKATCKLKNVYMLHSIGQHGKLMDKVKVDLILVLHKGVWKIRMEGPLQSGK